MDRWRLYGKSVTLRFTFCLFALLLCLCFSVSLDAVHQLSSVDDKTNDPTNRSYMVQLPISQLSLLFRSSQL
jgi:hypothetical protein